MKMTLKTARENLPGEVVERVEYLAKNYKTRKLSFTLCPKLYVSEDAKYLTWNGQEWRGIEAAGEWQGVNGCKLGFVDIPAGAYVVEWRWFLGKVFVTVYHNNGQAQVG